MQALKTGYRERLQLRHEADREESKTTVEYTLRCNLSWTARRVRICKRIRIESNRCGREQAIECVTYGYTCCGDGMK